jgi:iron complex transport system substrate-binding protein
LLAAEPMPLSLIAEACGYASLYYFSNAFKKAKGISPSEFRKMHRI